MVVVTGEHSVGMVKVGWLVYAMVVVAIGGVIFGKIVVKTLSLDTVGYMDGSSLPIIPASLGGEFP